MTQSTTILDHIVHLSPPDSLEETAAEFKRLGFTVVPGGSHTDGLTSNALIVLPDGVYLELIYFHKPNPPASHHWGGRELGWIDVAHLGTAENIDEVINSRYEGDSKLYEPAWRGGRETVGPESKKLEWRVTFANSGEKVGELPFFCEDLTPREWRVPAIPKSNTVHANGVLGISRVVFITPASNLAAFSKQLTAVVGSPPVSTNPIAGDSQFVWELSTPNQGNRRPTLLLRKADQSIDAELARGTGIFEVHFWISEGESRSLDCKWGRIYLVSLNSE